MAKSFLNNVFPHRSYNYVIRGNANPDSVQVLVDWATRDTTLDCDTYQSLYTTYYSMASADNNGFYGAPKLGGGGQGGSMARFTLINNFLYTVTANSLNTFDVSTAQQPSFVAARNLNNWGIETIFPFKEKLFIGSNSGMYIYNVSTPVHHNHWVPSLMFAAAIL
ncbi:hypothetical protein [Paraflavitalea speifideaquila]|uniref:hypothetical protein n=1 Tax=Paraflavitalea speifideaquila TaxID=3076558 RepID=UPI0028E39176|nr:hypothetical protein [Paraflavitalea speifideiaquila]